MAARQLTTLLTVLAVAAFVIFALRPACDLLPAHAAGTDDPAACCASVEQGDAFATLDPASAGPGGKALIGPLAIAYYFAGAVSLLGVTLLLTGAPLPVRSFYSRSTRILR